jgi:hypothetical protein
MTDVDRSGELQLQSTAGHVLARMPLSGLVSADWERCYQRLARATRVPARAEARDGRTWLVVRIAASSGHSEIERTLTAACALIGDTDAAMARSPAGAAAEGTARTWWARGGGAAPRARLAGAAAVRTTVGAEPRLVLAAALALAVAILLLLPARFSIGPAWLVPAGEAVLLAAIVAADRAGPAQRRPAIVRALSFALVLLLVAAAAVLTVRLVADLVEGGPETNSAADLLLVGSGVWVFTILAFAFLYWLLDGGGPERRILDPPEFPHLAFPEQLSREVAAPGWRPAFHDYVYLGFTNATAFSPTDIMPLAWWAKLAMTIQALGSLTILGLVIARAVNIFR